MQKLEKKVFINGYHVTKILTRYISVRVPDGPIVTIIVSVYKKYAFFQLVFELVTSGKSKIML